MIIDRSTVAVVLVLVGVVTAWASDAALASNVPVVTIAFFAEAGCHECERVEREILPVLEQRYAGRHAVQRYDIGETAHYLKLSAGGQNQPRMGT